MKTDYQLYLHEEVLLLALRDDEGTIEFGTMYQYAIGGAILAELLFKGLVNTEREGKKLLVHPNGGNTTGNEIIDECLAMLNSREKPAEARYWVSKFANIGKLKHRVAEGLCRQGILRADEEQILLLFNRKIYPEANPIPEERIVRRLHDAIFGGNSEVDTRTAVLLSLCDSTGILKVHFNKKELKEHKERLAKIANGDLAGKATQEAIRAMQAAIMVAVIVPAVVSTTVSS